MDRRNDIDWLRIAAVLLLIPYHTARVFNWEEDFYVKNDPTSDAAQRFVDFVGPWHMSLLFLLAGAASWLAFRHRGGLQYAGERAKRLLVPFFFGLAVIVPPQTWLAYRWHGKGDISFWDYYPKFWTTADENLEGYQGGFTPGHLWFVLALFAFSLVGLPLFLWLRNRASGKRVLRGFGRLSQVPGLVLLVPAAVLVLPWYLMGDDLSGQPPIGFFVVVVLGFMLFGDERIGRAIDRSWVWMLAVGVTAGIVYMWAEPRAGDLWDTAAGYFGHEAAVRVRRLEHDARPARPGAPVPQGGRRGAAVRDRGRLPVLHPAPDGDRRRRLRRLRLGLAGVGQVRPDRRRLAGAQRGHLRGRGAALGPGALSVRDEAAERAAPEPGSAA